MKKTIIIVAIAVLFIIALCLGVAIMMMPDPVEPAPVNIYTPNSLISTLGIEKPNREVERLFVIKTYQGEVPFDEMVKLAQVGGVEYYEGLDDKADDYLLITPFEINVKMEISSLTYDEYSEKYVPGQVVFKANGGEPLPDNYSLLLRYSRPSVPQYQIKLIKDDQTATYQIVNTEEDKPVKVIQFVKDDIDTTGSRVEQVGAEINIEDDSSNSNV